MFTLHLNVTQMLDECEQLIMNLTFSIYLFLQSPIICMWKSDL